MLAILMANDDDDYDNNEDNKSAEKSKCFFMKGKRKLFEKTCLWFSFQVRFHFVYLSLDQQQKTTVSTSLAQRTAWMTNHTVSQETTNRRQTGRPHLLTRRRIEKIRLTI